MRIKTGRRSLSVECLEARRVLATVTLNTDVGVAGELRFEVANAAPNDTIDFNLPATSETITLTMGELVIDRPLTIDGANTLGSGTPVTISAGGSSRVVSVTDGTGALIEVSLSNLTITGGNSVGNPTSETGGGIRNEEDLTISSSTITGNVGVSGGGIGNVRGSVMMDDSTVSSNTGGARGGGIHNTLGGYFSVTSSTISGNTVTRDDMFSTVGGGISNYGIGTVFTLTDSTVSGNMALHDDTVYAASGLGGGIGNDYYALMTLTNTTVSSNSGDFGGGAWVDDGAELQVTLNSQFNLNTVTERGGGAFGDDAAIINVSYSSFDGNVATNAGDGLGGALFAGPLVDLIVDNSTLSNNIVYGLGGADDYGRGGAIYASAFGNEPGTTVTITNSTILGNTALGLGGAINTGRLVRLLIQDSTLTGNSAGIDGGAIRASGFSGTPDATGNYLTILDSIISGNSASDDGGAMDLRTSMTTYIARTNVYGNYAYDRGGVMYTRGEGAPDVLYLNRLTIKDSTFSMNTAMDDAGALHIGRASETTIDNVQITGNSAADNSGGMRLSFGNTYPSSSTVSNSIVTGNSAGGSAGGIEVLAQHVTSITNTTIDSNYAGGSGAGLLSVGESRTQFINSTISNNYGFSTGAGLDSTNSYLLVQQSTISGNTTFANGGGAYLRLDAGLDPSLTITLEGATITNNYGISGGGVYNFVDTISTINNSIISGNSASLGLGPDMREAGTLVANYSLIGDNENTMLAEASPDANGNLIGGAGGGTIDARLGPLQDNGGPSYTHLPYSDSPAIDAGDPTIISGSDQRGFQRVVDGDAIPGPRVDMGSTEFGSMLVPSGDFNNDGLWNCTDIDDLVAQIVGATGDLAYDMNIDGNVDLSDITDATMGWLRAAGEINLGPGKSYIVADANLDGFVNGQDFVVWNTFKFTGGNGWCGADFNADGNTNGQDFVLWNSNKFTASDSQAGGSRTDLSEQPTSVETAVSGKANDIEEARFEQSQVLLRPQEAPARDQLLGSAAVESTVVLATADSALAEGDKPEARHKDLVELLFGGE